jgi:hypothetical protein
MAITGIDRWILYNIDIEACRSIRNRLLQIVLRKPLKTQSTSTMKLKASS